MPITIERPRTFSARDTSRSTGAPAGHFDVIVVGAGQAGLAVGYHLRQQGRRFLLVDAGPRVGHAWRSRYDSLRLFTPAAYSGLPGLPFPAPADDYPTKDEVAAYLEAYAARFDLPVRSGEPVTALEPDGAGYRVTTPRGAYTADQVVVAAGPFQQPFVPPSAAGFGADVFQVHSAAYRSPAQLPDGDVLVVGGGNSGAQIAEELAASHTVYLAVGERKGGQPARVLGRPIFFWLDRLGLMRAPAASAVGRFLRRRDGLVGMSLRGLEAKGVRLVGRFERAEGRAAVLAGGARREVAAVVWATGYRSAYPWLRVPVLDERGQPVHEGGITAAPGLYFVGLSWQRSRGSALLGWVGDDAAFVAARIAERAPA
jgi:putative flavoprotein involved in K+ transport